ncbi:MAG TPA: sigma-70 family RNA polymerase sigma factor [Candidatus Limnocylindrales bacterium]
MTGTSPPFDDVYRDYAATVYRYCLSQVGNQHDAEDLASEVFVSAFRDYERTRPDATLPWLLRIARNAVIDHYRRRARRGSVLARFLGRVSEVDLDADVEAEVVLRSEIQAVLAAMGRLRERDRELVGMRIAAGLSFGEIGRVLRISEHAATVATHRALQRLRAIVEVRP